MALTALINLAAINFLRCLCYKACLFDIAERCPQMSSETLDCVMAHMETAWEYSALFS